MKRSRVEGEIDSITMANCLMLLSRGAENDSMAYFPSRVFECKTCNRQFPSFQALGGHRASHKKPRLMMTGEDTADHQAQLQSLQMKPKTHECSVCGLEFAIGQALGGHMRRHRAGLSEGLSLPPPPPVPVLKRSSSSRRVLCLDLNLTPLENDLDLQLGRKIPPVVDCLI
ncbi:PREDICTED: zinc finger protein ZAT12 [Nelumbo nucifera]|uniref:Zinc finger protein ZAT12 n=1 Tax=Nelumbo nucifera TaxID=4432 RepID=A0A1U8A5B4_NELNU|nr:PREDICTED: zinc finger protein ZAT12 [Nelumbo nucifera]